MGNCNKNSPLLEIYCPLLHDILYPLGVKKSKASVQYRIAPFGPGTNPEALHEIVPPIIASFLLVGSTGKYNFLKEVKVYSKRAAKMKLIFKQNGFHLVYDKDMEEPISDGFYFTISRLGISGSELLFQMLRHGMAGIPLSTTGSKKEGIRICVSLIRETQFKELSDRLSVLDRYLRPNPVKYT